MHSSLFLLQAATNPMFGTLIMYVAIAAIFYFILWRPQQRQKKAHEQTIRALKRGDEVVTVGGIVGEVQVIKEATSGQAGDQDLVTIKSGESRLVVERGRIARITSQVRAASGATPAA